MFDTSRLTTAVVVTTIFAGFGYLVRGVTRSGALAGAAVSFALYWAAGPGAFLGLVAVFAVTWVATRLGYARKLKLGTAEKREGRSASQVLANLGVAGASSLLYAVTGNAAFLAGLVAALSEAAADTVSSECGQISGSQARLITTWRAVPAGTDGGVSLAGTFAGVAAAALVALLCWWAGLLPAMAAKFATGAGCLGMVADSYLGATLERRGWLRNNAVNLLSTLIAAIIAVALSSHL